MIDPVVTTEEARPPGLLRRLYDWVLGWAETPYGIPALFLIALAESSFFPIPPDVLLLGLALGAPRRAFLFAFVCAVGSVVGGVIGYGIGAFFYDTLGQPIVAAYGLEPKLDKVLGFYRENAFAAILVAGFSPIPYKAFTIAAGMAKIPLTTLVVASVVSRSARFFLVAAIVFFFGDKAREFIDRYFEPLTILFTLLLIGGIVLLKYVH